MISPFPFWPVTSEEGSTVYKQRQNCRAYSNPWCSKKDTNSFLGEMQCPWQTMYLNWATELHCIRNTNKDRKNGQSAKSTKPQVPQATSKPYSCALWVFKTIFFFPFLPSLIKSGTREDSHHTAPLHTPHKTKQPAGGAPVGSNFLHRLGSFSYPIIASNHGYFRVYRKFQKGKAVKKLLEQILLWGKLHNVWDLLLIQELFMGNVWWDPLEPQMMCSLSDGTKT